MRQRYLMLYVMNRFDLAIKTQADSLMLYTKFEGHQTFGSGEEGFECFCFSYIGMAAMVHSS